MRGEAFRTVLAGGMFRVIPWLATTSSGATGRSGAARGGRRASRSSRRWARSTSPCARCAAACASRPTSSQPASTARVKCGTFHLGTALAAALARRVDCVDISDQPSARARPADRPHAAARSMRSWSASRAQRRRGLVAGCARSISTSSSAWGRRRGSYRSFMEQRLFAHVNVDRRTSDSSTAARRSGAECERYERAIARAGGIDVMVLGIGATATSGSTSRPSAGRAHAIAVALDDATRAANALWFGGDLHRCRDEALTMGMGTILGARTIVLIATGEAKTEAVAGDARWRRDDAGARVVSAAAPAGDGDARRARVRS